jgi:hypothetical protein
VKITHAALLAVALFFPLTAVLHHAIFYRPSCMVNPFWSPTSTNMEIFFLWIQFDPSLYLGIAGSVVTYLVVRAIAQAAPFILAFVVATIPLSIWIWDLPFTGRVMCLLFHDDKTFIKTRHLYLLAVAAYFPIFYWMRRHSWSNR